MTTVASDFDHMELQQQYSSIDTVNNRWEDDWDNENSSARLFERSRIKALAGRSHTNAVPSEACTGVLSVCFTQRWIMGNLSTKFQTTPNDLKCDVTSCSAAVM